MGSLTWKRRIGRVLGRENSKQPRKVILLYHAISERAPAVSETAFREQMSWLHEHATVLGLPELLASRNPEGSLQIAITFDDGYASLHDLAAPILKDLGMAATVYLNSALISESKRIKSDPGKGHYPENEFLLWREVEHLVSMGWMAGSHGCHHVDLTAVEPDVSRHELQESQSEICNRLGRPCEHFAYTWGKFNRRLQEQVRSAGYKSAAGGIHGPLRGNDPFALPRIDIRSDYALDDFVAAVQGRWDWLGYKQRIARVLG